MSREIEKEILKMGLKIARYGVSKHIAELFDLDMKRTIITLINKAESIELVKKDSHNELYQFGLKKWALIYIFEYNFKHLSLKLNENNLNNLFS